MKTILREIWEHRQNVMKEEDNYIQEQEALERILEVILKQLDLRTIQGTYIPLWISFFEEYGALLIKENGVFEYTKGEILKPLVLFKKPVEAYNVNFAEKVYAFLKQQEGLDVNVLRHKATGEILKIFINILIY